MRYVGTVFEYSICDYTSSLLTSSAMQENVRVTAIPTATARGIYNAGSDTEIQHLNSFLDAAEQVKRASITVIRAAMLSSPVKEILSLPLMEQRQ
jgi:hypothetical protein